MESLRQVSAIHHVSSYPLHSSPKCPKSTNWPTKQSPRHFLQLPTYQK